jgi:hypothetical protein
MIFLALCSEMHVVQLIPAGGLESMWTLPLAADVVVDFERRLPARLNGCPSVRTMNAEEEQWHCSPAASGTAYAAADVCNKMRRGLISMNGPKCIGPCCRCQAALQVQIMADALLCGGCVWGRGLGAKLLASSWWCLGERAEQELPSAVAVVGCRSVTDWDRRLTAVEMAINSSCYACTGYTPHFLSYIQEMRWSYGIALQDALATTSVAAAATTWTDRAANDASARNRLADAQSQQEKVANRPSSCQAKECVVGDQVMLNARHLIDRPACAGSQCRFVRCSDVVRNGTGNVILHLPGDMRIQHVVDADRVKRYVPSVGERLSSFLRRRRSWNIRPLLRRRVVRRRRKCWSSATRCCGRATAWTTAAGSQTVSWLVLRSWSSTMSAVS